MRKAYLKLSMKIHPDKLKTPDAKKAFQVLVDASRGALRALSLREFRATSVCFGIGLARGQSRLRFALAPRCRPLTWPAGAEGSSASRIRRRTRKARR